MYTTIAVFGYLTDFDKTPELITERPRIPNTSDIAMSIAKCFLAFNITLAIPLRVNPCRTQFYVALNWSDNSVWKRILVTFLMMAISAFISIIYPKIYSAFAIIGGTLGTLLSITFPGKKIEYISSKIS